MEAIATKHYKARRKEEIIKFSLIPQALNRGMKVTPT